MKIILVALNLLLIIAHSCSQTSSEQKQVFSKEELRLDFNIFRTSLEEGHPALYHYKTKITMDSIFNSNMESIKSVMTDREFLIMLSKIVNQIGDGHLRVILPKFHKDKLDIGSTALPVSLIYRNNNLYVARNLSPYPDNDLIGAQVVSINDKTVSEFLVKYLELFSSDGSNVTAKFKLYRDCE